MAPLIHCHTSLGMPISAVVAFRIRVNTTIDRPSDAVMTYARRRACADEGVVLLDWIVVTGHHWCSLRDQVIREVA
jgi:hypothetical protein